MLILIRRSVAPKNPEHQGFFNAQKKSIPFWSLEPPLTLFFGGDYAHKSEHLSTSVLENSSEILFIYSGLHKDPL